MGDMAAAVEFLFEPFSLGSSSVTLPNRIVMAALTRARSVPTNVPNEVNLEYYAQRAKGGAGLIVTEATLTSPQGTDFHNAPGLWSEEQIIAWKRITDAVHAEGTFIFAQIVHAGRQAHVDMPPHEGPLLAPSAIQSSYGKFRRLPGVPGYGMPIPIENPEVIVEEFKQAAINAKKAGFDGVELHGAHGFLIQQFMDTTMNTRTDSWGGSAENCVRFPLEVIKACTEVFGPGRVALKLTPSGGYGNGRMTLEETLDIYRHLLNSADSLQMAYVCLKKHNAMEDAMCGLDKYSTPHDIFASYSPCLKRTPIMINGGITAEEAASSISSGQASLVAMGMPWIAHPDYAKRIRHGIPADVQFDVATLYGPGPEVGMEAQRKGYSDYPAGKL